MMIVLVIMASVSHTQLNGLPAETLRGRNRLRWNESVACREGGRTEFVHYWLAETDWRIEKSL